MRTRHRVNRRFFLFAAIVDLALMPAADLSRRPSFPADFSDPVAHAQSCFRMILQAIAEPGRVLTLDAAPPAPSGLDAATAAVCLTLLDNETTVWLDQRAERDPIPTFLSFLCGVGLSTTPANAAFALILQPRRLPRLDEIGLAAHLGPEDGATLILQATSLTQGRGPFCRGAASAERHRLSLGGMPDGFVDQFSPAPRAFDIILCCGNRLAALPRTARLEC
jgi:alpha-D-ribose 1-methylphosphonate 5-triphosphate synthase subunit PhnH